MNRCPRCQGTLLREPANGWEPETLCCLSCGWRPPDRLAGPIDLTTIGDRRREGAVGYRAGGHAQPLAWEFQDGAL